MVDQNLNPLIIQCDYKSMEFWTYLIQRLISDITLLRLTTVPILQVINMQH